MYDELPTPCIVIDAVVARRNLQRMADYARERNIRLRPHTKTHKSGFVGKLQIDAGAIGLTVAKAGEAHVMADVCDDVLMAYPAVDPSRCRELAALAVGHTVRVAIDSVQAAEALAAAARQAVSTIGVLVDLDVGHHRTGVQTPAEALALAQFITQAPGLRLDGVMFFPGHISGTALVQAEMLKSLDAYLGEVIDLWRANGLEAKIVSGGSTPAAMQSHLVTRMTEIRPGTYVYNDMNCVHGGSATLDDCAARIIATVVSTAVPGQIVLDAGTKTLTSDKCGPAPDSGHGHIVEYPDAKITKLSEEHAQVDMTRSSRSPKVGERVSIIPNHICPCVNLQDAFWWSEANERPRRMTVDARGKVS